MSTQIASTPIIKGRLAKIILQEAKQMPSPRSADGSNKIIALFENKKYTNEDKSITEHKQGGLKLSDLFKDYHGNYKPKEFDTGNPTGKEVL